jgi:hypothetical protein
MLQIDRVLSLTVSSTKAADRLAAAIRLALGFKLSDGAALELESARKAVRSLRIYPGVALARGFDERAAVIEASPSTDDEHEERQAASFIRRAVRP